MNSNRRFKITNESQSASGQIGIAESHDGKRWYNVTFLSLDEARDLAWQLIDTVGEIVQAKNKIKWHKPSKKVKK